MCFVDSDSQTLISLAQSEKIHNTPYMNEYLYIYSQDEGNALHLKALLPKYIETLAIVNFITSAIIRHR